MKKRQNFDMKEEFEQEDNELTESEGKSSSSMSSDEEEVDYSIFEVVSEEKQEPEEDSLCRKNTIQLSKDYSYNIIDQSQAFQSLKNKIIELKSNFDYLNLNESFIFKKLRENKFSISNTTKIIELEIMSLVEAKKKTKELEGEMENICLIDYIPIENNQGLKLSCDHLFCSECWHYFLNEKIDEGPSCLEAKCPYDGCETGIPIWAFEEFADKKYFGRYKNMLISEVTQNSSTMTHCVGKGCEYVLTTEEKFLSVNNRLKAMDACCSCGVLTCMRCKLRGHEPITCKMFKEWDGNLEKVMDALNEEWRSKNTKPCPKCKVDIEKNQGCMAMSCRNCKTRYCWNCLSTETVHYGGKCLKYKRDDSLDFSEEYLKRLQFYCDRYLEQQRSFEFNLERYQKISKKLNETSSIFQKVNTEITPRCLEFYLDAVKFIAKSRSFIIYTYPLAFQIMGERRTDLFSQTQYFLQYALEVFDDYIEKHPLDLLIDQNETGYCLRAKFSSIKAKILELETNLFKQFQNARKDFCDPDFLLSVELDFKDRQRALKSRKEGFNYSEIFDDYDEDRNLIHWNCVCCTYLNQFNNDDICAMCLKNGRPHLE